MINANAANKGEVVSFPVKKNDDVLNGRQNLGVVQKSSNMSKSGIILNPGKPGETIEIEKVERGKESNKMASTTKGFCATLKQEFSKIKDWISKKLTFSALSGGGRFWAGLGTFFAGLGTGFIGVALCFVYPAVLITALVVGAVIVIPCALLLPFLREFALAGIVVGLVAGAAVAALPGLLVAAGATGMVAGVKNMRDYISGSTKTSNEQNVAGATS